MSERRGPLKGVKVVELACIMAGPVCDITAGIPGALGVSAAYAHRVQTGEGQRVDASLFEAAITHTCWRSAITFANGHAGRRRSRRSPPPRLKPHVARQI